MQRELFTFLKERNSQCTIRDFAQNFLKLKSLSNDHVINRIVHEYVKNIQNISVHKDLILMEQEDVPAVKSSLLLQDITFVVFDLETTGQTIKEKIIEIGAVKIRNMKIESSFTTLINPGFPISKFIRQLTGIPQHLLDKAPFAEDILPEFYDFIKDSVLVAHNKAFDVRLLKRELIETLMLDLNNPSVCTVKLSRRLLQKEVKSHSLDNLILHFGLNHDDRHRAFQDAENTAQIFLKFLKRFKELGINTLKELMDYEKKSIKNVETEEI